MARRRRKTGRRRSRGLGLNVGGISRRLTNLGMAFAVGAGTMAGLNFVGRTLGVPQVSQIAPIAGALSASGTGGIEGIVAAFSLVQGSGLLGGVAGGQQGAGVGAFV